MGHPSVIATAIFVFRSIHRSLDRIIKTRGCAYYSYLREVERVMSILNLGLCGVALERPRIPPDGYPGMEHLFTSSKMPAGIHAAGKRHPLLVNGLNTALEPMCELLCKRFRLELKGFRSTVERRCTHLSHIISLQVRYNMLLHYVRATIVLCARRSSF